jgi:hypothetical protein
VLANGKGQTQDLPATARPRRRDGAVDLAGAELDHVYRVRQTRDQLDYDDAAELRELLAAY